LTFDRTNTKHETLHRNSGHRGGTGGAAQTALTVPGITTRVTATGFILSVPTTVGINCLIEFTDSLTAAGWTKLAEVNATARFRPSWIPPPPPPASTASARCR